MAKHPNLVLPAQIQLSVSTVGVGRLRIVANLAGDDAQVTVECPELLSPGVLMACLAAVQHYIKQQTGADPAIDFNVPAVEAL